MKSILFGIVVLLALQGCSYPQRYIKSCPSHPIQCKKDKKIITNILGKGGLEAENNLNRNLGDVRGYALLSLIVIIPVVGTKLLDAL